MAERPVALPPVIQKGAGIMTIDHQCEGYARECVRLAGLAKDQELRDQLIDMAREWIAAAVRERPEPAASHSEA